MANRDFLINSPRTRTHPLGFLNRSSSLSSGRLCSGPCIWYPNTGHRRTPPAQSRHSSPLNTPYYTDSVPSLHNNGGGRRLQTHRATKCAFKTGHGTNTRQQFNKESQKVSSCMSTESELLQLIKQHYTSLKQERIPHPASVP